LRGIGKFASPKPDLVCFSSKWKTKWQIKCTIADSARDGSIFWLTPSAHGIVAPGIEHTHLRNGAAIAKRNTLLYLPLFGDGHAIERIAAVLSTPEIVFGQNYDRLPLPLLADVAAL